MAEHAFDRAGGWSDTFDEVIVSFVDLGLNDEYVLGGGERDVGVEGGFESWVGHIVII